MARTFSQTSGLALVSFSAQNIDRLITVYDAARAAGRELVIDLYSAAVAAAIENPLVPQAGWPGVRVWLPQNQRVRIKKTGAFERVEAVRPVRIFPKALARSPERFVLLFRSSMAWDLERFSALSGASLTWSLWPGYLDQPSGQNTRRWLARHGIDLVHHHSSGHAYIPDLQRFVRGLAPRTVVPIHSFAPERFSQYFDCVVPKQDGPWWEVT
jgi:ribonuclease J